MGGVHQNNKRYQVLGALRIYIETRKQSPSLQELCFACGIKGRATVRHYLNQLQEEGLVKKADGKQRSIKLLGPATFMRLPEPKRGLQKKSKEQKPDRHQKKLTEAECLERAVALGKQRDAEIREDAMLARGSLFRNERLRAVKVG